MSHGRVPASGCIVLVGFMAAGKTTTGRLLARRLGWRFVDFDEAIEAGTGRTPAALIREEGEARLREEEARLTARLAGCHRAVLAPGGGWITQPELVARLGPDAVLVWLRLSAEEAVRRAEAEQAGGDPSPGGAPPRAGAPSGPVDRPLLGPREGRIERAAALLRRREPRYAAARVVVDVEGKEPEAVVDEILRHLSMDREDDE